MLMLSLNYQKLVDTLFVKQMVNKGKAVLLWQRILQISKKNMSGRTVNNYRHRGGTKPFHDIPKPLKSETHISDRL